MGIEEVTQAIEDSICYKCEQPVLSFEDGFSERYYLMTGICENCQLEDTATKDPFVGDADE